MAKEYPINEKDYVTTRCAPPGFGEPWAWLFGDGRMFVVVRDRIKGTLPYANTPTGSSFPTELGDPDAVYIVPKGAVLRCVEVTDNPKVPKPGYYHIHLDDLIRSHAYGPQPD